MPSPAKDCIDRHPRQPVHPGTAQELQQQCLCLVIAVLGRQQAMAGIQPVSQRHVPGLAGGRLRTLARPRTCIDSQDGQGQIERGTHRPAMVSPGIGFHLQSVVDMNRPDRPVETLAQCGHGMQQHGGIQSATVGHLPGRRQWL